MTNKVAIELVRIVERHARQAAAEAIEFLRDGDGQPSDQDEADTQTGGGLDPDRRDKFVWQRGDVEILSPAEALNLLHPFSEQWEQTGTLLDQTQGWPDGSVDTYSKIVT